MQLKHVDVGVVLEYLREETYENGDLCSIVTVYVGSIEPCGLYDLEEI